VIGGGLERIDENEIGATGSGSVRKIWGIERDLWVESVGLLMNASFEVLSISSMYEERRGYLRVRGHLYLAVTCDDNLGT